ncbi:TonB family protein [Celeribacter sp.]|uniref:cell envelope integrity protein TolA n=1 Tax=Celeribacter sp. TaxID=1890673 RepID=UPI003A8CA7DF
MKQTFRPVTLVAATTAICIHGAVAIALMPPHAPVEMEGQTGGLEAQIGTAFADMSAGTISATPVENSAITPPEQPSVTPSESTPTKPLTPTAPPIASTPPATVSTVTPQTTATLTPQSVTTAITATPDPESQALKKHKPAPRPAPKAVAKKTPKKTVKTPPKPKATAAPRGNAKTTARAGQTDGTQAAKTVSKGSGGKTKETGNAAASNYPGLVMRKLSRVSRPRVSTKGVAVVSFKVAANGGLAAVSLSRSSGSAELDRAALKVVQRAAPFPAPPSGARRSFSIEIKGR